MAWYDNYLDMGKTDRSANPSPGNKKGGLANVVEKALGSIAKSGKSAIVEVLSPGQRPDQTRPHLRRNPRQRFCLRHPAGSLWASRCRYSPPVAVRRTD
ncbi:D-galactarate dehydratase [Klebsiella pneumoniae subsp. ozaenae]|uniref:D-galactarate dehydratase n=1 Tax=Klebsiella pneumoniae subsp. ozaenae TaxID=574 RepID=A0A378AHC0_KLEPO|nr:D-galactarate dehydratase [Klebsiella pneumoniae subsp. ozaenae]